jgi:uncharacterized protein (TIGR00369 family)
MAQSLDALRIIQERIPPFSKLLGIDFISATPERVVATLTVREELSTPPAILHGGAVMAFADTLGAVATVINLEGGQATTTIESKTNFFAPAPVGTKVTGECTALHRGRRTMAWQTRITAESGRLVAVVTQTQMVLEPEKTA